MGLALAAAALAGGCSDDDGDGGITIGSDLVLRVDPTRITFGAVVVGGHAERTVTLQHAGTTGVLSLRKVELVTGSGEITSTVPGKTRLEPGESTTMVVSYDPTDGVPDSGKVVIDTNVPTQDGGALTVEIPIETVTSAGLLNALPNPVDFGEVPAGEAKARTVTLLNVGANTITIDAIEVLGGPDGDFSLTFLPTLPTDISPDGTLTVEVTYAPTRANTDQGKLDVHFTVEGQAREIDPQVLLLGREVGPRLVAFPNPVDFGPRPLDLTAKQTLTLANQGSRDLVITGIALAEGSSDTIVVNGVPAGETTLIPGGVLPLEIAFTPTTNMVQTTGSIATLVVTSNDGANDGKTDIRIFGRGQVPVLQVNPPDVLEFGFVAQSHTRRRALALFNAGTSPLTISSIRVSESNGGEFALVTDESFAPTMPTPAPAVLAPAAYKEVNLEFTNDGADSGTAWGKVVIDSNDGQRPAWEVSLKAQRTGAPTCEMAIVGLPLDFGTVPRGFQRTRQVQLVNVGSGDCSFHSAFVNDCSGFFGFFGGFCEDPNNTFQLDGTSQVYDVSHSIIAAQGGLKAGQSHPLDITFTPPPTAPLFGDEMTDYAGFVGVRIIDPYSGTADRVIYPKPLGGTTSSWTPNLHAKSGLAQLAVLPGEVDFGLTTIGCHSQTIEVTAYNVGNAPLDLTDIKLENCSPEFRIKESPGLPSTLDVNASEMVKVVYVPQDRNADECGLGFYVADEQTPTIVVPLRGEGTFETDHTDTYVQTTGQDVDVLFVVDDSGSMSDEQSNLANNFQSFISGAATWNNDYHIAVVSTDMEGRSGNFFFKQGNQRVVTSANVNQFKDNVKVGDWGSGFEKGLAAAQAALSLPNIADSGVACTQSSQCTQPETCVDGYCGGPNRGFLREDAALEIVFVSDEEDQSPGTVAFYVNFLKQIKGFYNTNMMHAHAIVGDTPNGCSSSHGGASPGFRYLDVAQQTGGAQASICDPSFATALSSIGDIAFGLRTQFFLSRIPDPSTITVTVAGAGCTSASQANWFYDQGGNSVVFKESGACMPQAGQQVQIHYETICFLE